MPASAKRQPTRAARPSGAAFYRPERYQPQESIAFMMRRILEALSGEVEREFEPSGLTNAQWLPLFKLHIGSASTVAELARECRLDPGGMTRLLDRLESKDLVRRVRSSADRRVVNLELTAAGRAAAATIPAVLCRVQNAALHGFSAEEWHLLRELLGRVLENARSVQAQRGAPP